LFILDRVLGAVPKDKELDSYLEAYFGDRLSADLRGLVISELHKSLKKKDRRKGPFDEFVSFLGDLFGKQDSQPSPNTPSDDIFDEASKVASLLMRSTEEMDSIVEGLDGGYIKPAPGGDLLRDGPAVLPTGRNIHALDPYRMPSASAWVRGQKAADEIIRQHRANNNDQFPETVAVTLWGLDAIKTRGESVAIALALVGAKPVKEGTGRIVRYDLVPLEELGRPRVDVLASLSGIFR
jgi:magnesium chelatase subunit H